MTSVVERRVGEAIGPGAASGGLRSRGDATMAGTWRLIALIVRRDRIRLLIWLGGLIVLMAVSAGQVRSLYDTPESIRTYVASFGDNPALVVFAGPGYGFDAPNVGVVLVNETSLWTALAAALMSIFLINRHTRAEEESERADLVRSMVVGRHAPTVAALLVALAANVIVAAGSAVATIAIGFPAAGTVALCASFAMVGVAFAGVAAVCAQIAPTGRSMLGLATGLLGLAFVVRGIGDIGAIALSWMTPFGWGIGIRAFAGERWWTVAGLVGFAVVLTAAAFALSVRRDLGSGILTQRPGPPRAAVWTTRPIGLAVRLQRAAVLGWAVGMFVLGMVYGSIGNEIERMLEDNPQLGEYLARLENVSISDSYLGTALSMLAMMGSGFAVSSALRARSEESAGYAESMLATPMSRWSWTSSHLIVTIAGVVTVMLAAGLGVGVGYAVAIGDGSQVLRLLGAGLATVPAVLVLVGAATLLFGCAPRFAIAAWGVFSAVLVIGVFGAVLRLPQLVLDLSPFEHLAPMPARPFAPLPAVVLLALAALLSACGMVGFRRRDLASG